MIIGLGHDMIEIERIKRACEKKSFLSRIYTEKEISTLLTMEPTTIFSNRSLERLAANFTVKESVVKALGVGFSCGIKPQDIEVLRDEKGAPYVNLYNKALEVAREKGVKHIHVSITHIKEVASSVVILDQEE
jgi:holo-[acyl-carrier protein] synthase